MNYYNHVAMPVLTTVNNQYMAGCNMGRQGIFAEQSSNLWAAMQLYDQAINLIQQSLELAYQYGIPAANNVYYDLALAHFSNARVKNMLGWSEISRSHLHQALAINPCLAQSIPNVSPMQSTPPPQNNYAGEQTNWIKTVNEVAKTVSNVVNALNDGVTLCSNFNQQFGGQNSFM